MCLRCVQEVPKQVHSKVRDCPPCCFSFQVYEHPGTHIRLLSQYSSLQASVLCHVKARYKLALFQLGDPAYWSFEFSDESRSTAYLIEQAMCICMQGV